MKIISLARGAGRTTELIKISAQEKKTIVCYSFKEADRIKAYAEHLGLTIPTPLTYGVFLDNQKMFGRDLKMDYMIDNLEMFLERVSPYHIAVVTVETE